MNSNKLDEKRELLNLNVLTQDKDLFDFYQQLGLDNNLANTSLFDVYQ